MVWLNALFQKKYSCTCISPNRGKRLLLIKSIKSPLLYLIYLDDILFFIWPHSKKEFWKLFKILYQQDDNIKLIAPW